MNQLLTRLAIVVSVTVLVGGLAAMSGNVAGRMGTAPPVAAQVPAGSEPAIVVVSDGSASAQPDQAIISVGVQALGQTASGALTEANARTEAILGKLDELGVPRAAIQTSGVGLTPVQDSPTRPGAEPVITGYRASNTLTVQVAELARVGQILDALVGAGANQISGVRFAFSDSSGLRARALDEAVQKARPQADAIAAGLGLKAGRVLGVRQDSVGGPPAPAAADSVSRGAVPIEPGQLTVRAQVQVTFALVQ